MLPAHLAMVLALLHLLSHNLVFHAHYLTVHNVLAIHQYAKNVILHLEFLQVDHAQDAQLLTVMTVQPMQHNVSNVIHLFQKQVY